MKYAVKLLGKTTRIKLSNTAQRDAVGSGITKENDLVLDRLSVLDTQHGRDLVVPGRVS